MAIFCWKKHDVAPTKFLFTSFESLSNFKEAFEIQPDYVLIPCLPSRRRERKSQTLL
jgi:hypothetical protein